MSYLIQVRGLKRNVSETGAAETAVVPYIGTWIETARWSKKKALPSSYLIQVRGLKLDGECTVFSLFLSYLIQVRGLKHIAGYRTLLYHPSYLIQVRGLKRQAAEMPTGDITSYLIQVRGLKPSFCRYSTLCFYVVPYIGTWIETIRPSVKRYEQEVVPYIGTWIETAAKGQRPVRDRSYLIQVRGLKRCYFER